jgi:hypothetical protein
LFDLSLLPFIGARQNELLKMGNEEARFHYLEWRDLFRREKPYEIFINLPPEQDHVPRTNLSFKRAPIAHTVHDVRGHEQEFDLDTHGFTWRSHSCSVEKLRDDNFITAEYLPQMEQFIKSNVEGADRIVFFDWRASRFN